MSHGPKTVEAAKALAEVRDLFTGRYFLGSGKVEGDSICFFRDDDGETKYVECIRRSRDGQDEWVKIPA